MDFWTVDSFGDSCGGSSGGSSGGFGTGGFDLIWCHVDSWEESEEWLHSRESAQYRQEGRKGRRREGGTMSKTSLIVDTCNTKVSVGTSLAEEVSKLHASFLSPVERVGLSL